MSRRQQFPSARILRGLALALPLLLLLLLPGLASAETLLLRSGEVVEGNVIAVKDGTVVVALASGGKIELADAELDELSSYRALRQVLNLSRGEDRLQLGDKCLALGLPELALAEYQAAVDHAKRLLPLVEGKRSLVRSVLAYGLWEESMQHFEEGRLAEARDGFRELVENTVGMEHITEAARVQLFECEKILGVEAEPASPQDLRDAMAFDQISERVESLLARAEKEKREALLAGDLSARSRQFLLDAHRHSRQALQAAESHARKEVLSAARRADADALVARAREAVIDANLKLAHVHLLAGDTAGAGRYVDRVLAMDARHAGARSLLRLIAARAEEGGGGDDGTEVVDRRKYRIARTLRGRSTAGGCDTPRGGTAGIPGRTSTPPPPPRGGGGPTPRPSGGGAPGPRPGGGGPPR